MTISHICSDPELVTLVLVSHLETVVIVLILYAAGLKTCVEQPHFRVRRV